VKTNNSEGISIDDSNTNMRINSVSSNSSKNRSQQHQQQLKKLIHENNNTNNHHHQLKSSSSSSFQVYPIRINSSTNEKMDSVSTLVSLNFIDVKSSTARSIGSSNSANNSPRNIVNNNNNNINNNKRLNNFKMNSNQTKKDFDFEINKPKTIASNINLNQQNIINNQQQHQQSQLVNWNDESNSGWTSTGVMSDRSSIYSIDDGDFDKEASRQVNKQLKEIESILYEQNETMTPKSASLIECKEWLEKFPHIRILGNQIPNVYREDYDSNKQTTMSHSYQSQMSFNNKLPLFTSTSLVNQLNNNESSPTPTKRRESSDINNQK
jgi:hypothetical protein